MVEILQLNFLTSISFSRCTRSNLNTTPVGGTREFCFLPSPATIMLQKEKDKVIL